MSWTTGTQTECLAANSANGTAIASSTTATLLFPSAASAFTPANFWLPTYGAAKALQVKAFGVLGTSSTPNFTLELCADTTQGTRNASGIVATTTTVTGPNGVTNAPWELDCLVTCNTTGPGTGGNGAFLAMGIMKIYTSGTGIQQYRFSSSTANPNTSLALSTQSAYYWELWATWGASSASNTITGYNVAYLGLN
jgi:hypothetical protein